MLGSDYDQISTQTIAWFVFLLGVCIVLGDLLEKNRWINNTIIALLIGFGTGGVILMVPERKRSLLFKFDGELLFSYILPPIIFNAGLQVKKKQFFHNFTTISLFGAFGTLISSSVISLGAVLFFKHLDAGFLDTSDYLAIGAIFAATDSVSGLQVLSQEETPFVYSLVFGESVVNDATSLVLFNVIRRLEMLDSGETVALHFTRRFLYLSVASTLLGVLVGLLCAYIMKKMSFVRHSAHHEITVVLLMAYISYMSAELFNISGILSVFFCGIVMSHYSWQNMTESSRTATTHVSGTFSLIAEIFIFLYVGMDALDVEKWRFVINSVGTSVGVSSILFGLIMVGRAASIFPLSLLANLTTDEKIEFKEQVVIWWAGLMRGSVSMVLAYNQFAKSGHTLQRGNAIMITSAISVIFFSTLVFGMLTKPLLRFLASSTLFNNTVCSKPTDSGMVNELARIRMLLTTPTRTLHFYWREFDDAFMCPVFVARRHGPTTAG